MDMIWIQLATRGKPEYMKGVKEFINFASAHLKEGCPCVKCNNARRLRPISEVEDHLYSYGMVKDYTTWTKHGEVEFDDLIENDDIIKRMLEKMLRKILMM